jgi:hypothetical protein
MTPIGVKVDPPTAHNLPILRYGVGQAGRRSRVKLGSRSTHINSFFAYLPARAGVS